MTTGSTKPHALRPSAAELDKIFSAHNTSEHVRTVHGLYVDCAIALMRVAHRFTALNEHRAAGMVEALVVMIEQQAIRHIQAIALRTQENGGGHG